MAVALRIDPNLVLDWPTWLFNAVVGALNPATPHEDIIAELAELGIQ